MRKTLILLVICLIIIAVIYYFFKEEDESEFLQGEAQIYGFGTLVPVTGIDQALGCTDPDADNYNPLATINANCLYIGCADPTASNYDPMANVTDIGICTYDG
jgi:hypothetical protein